MTRQIATLRSQVEEVSVQEAALLGEIDDVDARLRALDGDVADLDASIGTTQRQLDASEAELDRAEARFLDASDALDRTRAALATSRQEMRQRAVAAYTSGPAFGGYAGLVLGSRTTGELDAGPTYVRAVLRKQAETVRRFRHLRDGVVRQTRSLERARRRAFDQRDDVARRKRALTEARRSRDGVRREVQARAADRQRLLAEVTAHKAEFQAQILALRAESISITQLLAARQAGQARQPSGHGLLTSPVPGAQVTSGFGPRVHPILGDVRMHTGVDLGASAGTPILAAAGGEVVFAGPRGGYGNTAIIDHGGSLATLYGHQSRIVVVAGDHVDRGQVIGFVGCTGYCTGPHLHFEVRVAGVPVDPLPYL